MRKIKESFFIISTAIFGGAYLGHTNVYDFMFAIITICLIYFGANFVALLISDVKKRKLRKIEELKEREKEQEKERIEAKKEKESEDKKEKKSE